MTTTTTTFTLLLFNFYLFPQAFPCITDFSVPLSVFLSVHLSFPFFSSPLLPWCFLSFHPTLSRINNPFLISLCFFIHLSIFLPYLFPFNSPVACCRSLRPLKPILFHLRPFVFVLFCPAAISVCLFITHSSCLCLPSFVPLSSLLLVWYSSCPSSHPHEPDLLLFYLHPRLAERVFAFDVHIFPSLNAAAALIQSQVSLVCLSSLFCLFFLPPCPLRSSVIEHWGKLDREKEQTCSRAQREISKISLRQWEMVITVDRSQGIKLLLMAFRCTHCESIAFISLCFFFSLLLSLSVKLSVSWSHFGFFAPLLSEKLNSERDQLQ